MQPTIKPGQNVVIDYSAYRMGTPKRWDIVALRLPSDTNEMIVLRVVAIPGETVSFATGMVSINGKSLGAPPKASYVRYVPLSELQDVDATVTNAASPYFVPRDSYFVLGDNSSNSYDSRFWGAVTRSNILGKVTYIR